jgi:HEAT repeat protein
MESDTRDPSLPHFQTGDRVLFFLDLIRKGEKLVGVVPVDGVHGTIFLPEGTGEISAQIAHQFAAGGGLSLPTSIQFLTQSDTTPPPMLVGTLLEHLADTITPADAPALRSIACDSQGEYLPAARFWAIGQIGTNGFGDSRPCLEEIAGAGADGSAQLAATEALGDLGDPRSAPVLLSLLILGQEGAEDPFLSSPDGGLALSLILSLGKIGDPQAVEILTKVAMSQWDLAHPSTAVHALGLIGGQEVVAALTRISENHPNELIRDQAASTLARVQAGSGSTGESR